LGLYGLAGNAVGRAGAWGLISELGGERFEGGNGGITGVQIGVEAGDAGGFGGFVDGYHVVVYGASLERKRG